MKKMKMKMKAKLIVMHSNINMKTKQVKVKKEIEMILMKILLAYNLVSLKQKRVIVNNSFDNKIITMITRIMYTHRINQIKDLRKRIPTRVNIRLQHMIKIFPLNFIPILINPYS